MTRRVGVVTFPGSLDDRDALDAVARCGGEGVPVWHGEGDLRGVDALILPGGFSYGDYLRCGAIAHRAPVMGAVRGFAADGGPVLGICNGFQILTEAGLLPGALLRNVGLSFVCRGVDVVVEAETAWTRGARPGTHVHVPLKSGEGRYHADDSTLDALEANGQVVARYAPGHNVNGSARGIAGVCNDAANVVGLMPHPEHAVDESLPYGTAGEAFLAGVLEDAAVA